MQTLFIDRKYAELELDRGRLVVRIESTRTHFSVPLHLLEMLVISASIQFSSTLLTGLTQEGVTVVFLNPRKIEASTMTHGLMHNDAERRLLQYQAIVQPALRLTYAQEIVREKIRGHRALLKHLQGKRPDCRYKLFAGCGQLGGLIKRCVLMDNISSLRGLEGAAGAIFFEAYQSVFAPSLSFNERNRRPPLDPVNVLLSLTFTMLHAESVRALFATGFDPMLGIYHEPTFGRESLACDLVELFRPMAERWVWQIFATETLRIEHFSYEREGSEGRCLLGKAGREIYYTHYETHARGWRKLMRRITRHWLNRLRADMSGKNDGFS